MATTVTAGPETRVNTNTANDQALPRVATLLDGSYVVTWYSNNSTDNISTQRFDASGSPLGGETLVNTTTADHGASVPLFRNPLL
jgi:serralysin